jgi:hypothetical protein
MDRHVPGSRFTICAQHAAATTARLTVRQEQDCIRLNIQDDGRLPSGAGARFGPTGNAGGCGSLGRCSFGRSASRGTTVSIVLPTGEVAERAVQAVSGKLFDEYHWLPTTESCGVFEGHTPRVPDGARARTWNPRFPDLYTLIHTFSGCCKLKVLQPATRTDIMRPTNGVRYYANIVLIAQRRSSSSFFCTQQSHSILSRMPMSRACSQGRHCHRSSLTIL